jgi:hypothetical protein
MREVALVAIPMIVLFCCTRPHVIDEARRVIAWNKLMATRNEYDNSLDMRASRSRHPTATRVKR